MKPTFPHIIFITAFRPFSRNENKNKNDKLNLVEIQTHSHHLDFTFLVTFILIQL